MGVGEKTLILVGVGLFRRVLRDSTPRFVRPLVSRSVCPSVRPSVRPSVHPSIRPFVRHARVENAKKTLFHDDFCIVCFCVSMRVGGLGMGLG